MGGSEIDSFTASGGVVLVVLAVIASSSRGIVCLFVLLGHNRSMILDGGSI